MKALIRCRSQAEHQALWCGAMKDGLSRHGVQVEVFDGDAPGRGDFMVCWGWRVAKRYVSRMPVLVLERGYVGDRFAWTSAGWNGLNGRATFAQVNDGGARWREHLGHLILPWQSEGEYVLIAGQVQGDAALDGVDIRRWYRETAQTLREIQSLPVFFRPHPLEVERNVAPVVRDAPTLGGSLSDALAGAALLVSWNSNAAVDAVLAGVPVVACDRGSMAWPVAAHGVAAARVWPDRAEWLARLAWSQWSKDEMHDGTAWEHLRAVMNG